MSYALLALLLAASDTSSEMSSMDPQPTPEMLNNARRYAQDCIKLSMELSDPDTLFSARVILARIDAAEGNLIPAIAKIGVMLAETTDDEQAADLYYWLWKIDGAPAGAQHDEALTRLESLWSRIPKFEFCKRIAELRGEKIPMSADE